MKTLKRTWLAGAVLGVLAGAAATQDNPAPRDPNYPKPAQDYPKHDRPGAKSADKDLAPITTGTPAPASKLIGKDVKDTAVKMVGDVTDFVADEKGVVAIIERERDVQLVGL